MPSAARCTRSSSEISAPRSKTTTLRGKLRALLKASGELHRQDPTLAPVAITVQFEVQRDPQIRDGMADALASFQALAADIAATAPTKVLDLHGLRSVTLAIIAVLNGLSSLGATMQDPAELIGTTSALRDIMFGGR